MSGLKSGSGDDLWDDDADGDRDDVDPESGGDDPDPDGTPAGEGTNGPEGDEDGSASGTPSTGGTGGGSGEGHSYIVRRAIRDKSVQFERDERLTFFVHDDVAEGERELRTEVESVLGRDVPKFDVREAVYRAALRNREDVLNELVEMGYSPEG